MADKRVRRLDQRAYRLWRLAQQLRDRSDLTAEVLPEDDWFDTVTFDYLTVTCRPTVPLDPDEPWLFTVHHEEPDASRRNAKRGAGIEIDADTLTSTGGVQIRGGNVDAAAQQIISIAAADHHHAAQPAMAGAATGRAAATARTASTRVATARVGSARGASTRAAST